MLRPIKEILDFFFLRFPSAVNPEHPLEAPYHLFCDNIPYCIRLKSCHSQHLFHPPFRLINAQKGTASAGTRLKQKLHPSGVFYKVFICIFSIMDSIWTVNLILNVFLPPFLVEPHCRQRGINFAVLQNSKVCGLHSVSVGADHVPQAHCPLGRMRTILARYWIG